MKPVDFMRMLHADVFETILSYLSLGGVAALSACSKRICKRCEHTIRKRVANMRRELAVTLGMTLPNDRTPIEEGHCALVKAIAKGDSRTVYLICVLGLADLNRGAVVGYPSGLKQTISIFEYAVYAGSLDCLDTLGKCGLEFKGAFDTLLTLVDDIQRHMYKSPYIPRALDRLIRSVASDFSNPEEDYKGAVRLFRSILTYAPRLVAEGIKSQHPVYRTDFLGKLRSIRRSGYPECEERILKLMHKPE